MLWSFLSYHTFACSREGDDQIKNELVEKLKANIPEARITSEVGPGGEDMLKKFAFSLAFADLLRL